MRRIVLIFSSLLLAISCGHVGQNTPMQKESDAFVTRWQGEAGEPIQVPLYGNYAYRWEKADGTEVKVGVATVEEGDLLELPVPEAGAYVLKAGPAGVKRIEFGVRDGWWYEGSCGTPGALREVSQWGSVAWESLEGAFVACGNMNVAEGAGAPDLRGVTSMQSAFGGCTSFNSPIGAWDVSKVTNMGGMFDACSTFNQPLEKWDVSNVENMEEIFSGCRAFNQPLGNWTLSALAYNEGLPHDLGLSGSGLDVANYSSTLSAWAAKRDQLKIGVRVEAGRLEYNAVGAAARQQLIEGSGWEFLEDSEAP